jgi:O-antigen/teichoic acid export membrane protein
VSELLATVFGFVATVYFARVLGAETLGVYFLVIAVYTWLKLFGTMGFRQSVVKRLSEGHRRNQRFTAAVVLQLGLVLIVIAIIFFSSSYINEYVGREVALTLILLTLAGTTFTFAGSVLRGEKVVHLAGMLKPTERIIRTILQVALVAMTSFTLFGLLYGHIGALVLASLLGLSLISSHLSVPNKSDITSVLSFAKYSWLGGISTRTFNALDTIILGFFVGSSLIGIYEIAWNVASVLAIFGSSVSKAVFPEISDLSKKDRVKQAESILNDALAFTGLFTIPGLVGAIILGEYVLGIYGPEFRQGSFVLIILIIARLFAAYQWQFVNALGAFDRPDLAFKVNVIFIIINILLNVILVWQYGWTGAAAATAFSAGLALLLGYMVLNSIIEVQIPYGAISRQVTAALLMGLFIALAKTAISISVPKAVMLIIVGGVIYFVVLFSISVRFRTTVIENMPKLASR